MSTNDSQNGARYHTLFKEAFEELQTQSPELSAIFLRDIYGEGYLSLEELSSQEKLFRLLLFFEYYVLAIPSVISNTKKQHDKINGIFKEGHIADVDLRIIQDGQEQSEITLSQLASTEQLAREELQGMFDTILDGQNLRQPFEAFKTRLRGHTSYEYE